MKAPHLITGEKGESLATKFLIQKGYKLLSRNYRFKKAEIDLVVRTEDELVFVEVKTRRNSSFGYPEEMVSKKKQELMVVAMEAFQIENNLHYLEPRFDIVSITLTSSKSEVTHIENAFFPDWGTQSDQWQSPV